MSNGSKKRNSCNLFLFFLAGTYVPMCDQDGYYQPMQCHTATGMCWCVNKHGVEFANSRTHGEVDCG